jgi:hypothetical protein
MAGVLTEGSKITCGTEGVVAARGQSKLTVDGKPVLVLDGVNGKEVKTCATVTDANTGLVKCSKVAAVAAGEAAKLTVGNAPVLLAETFAGTTDGIHPSGVPAAVLSAAANQTLMTAV